MRQKVRFGADGIRTVAGSFPLHRATVTPIGKALGIFLRRRSDAPVAVIGRDTRTSGTWITDSLVAGLVSQGVDVLLLDVITTPGAAFFVQRQASQLGIVVSASHCPFDYNGIKLLGPQGLRLQRRDEIEIEKLIQQCLHSEPPLTRSYGNVLEAQHLLEQYIYEQVRLCRLDLGLSGVRSLEGFRLVLDCANGAAGKIAPRIFGELGASVSVVNASSIGNNINYACGAEYVRRNPHETVVSMLEHNAQYAFALDGDADRLIVVDSRGAVYDGNDLLYILAKHYDQRQELRGHKIVTNLLANRGLEHSLRLFNINTRYVKNGDRNLEAAIWKADYLLGGEEGGNIIINDRQHTAADAVFTALILAKLLADTGSTVAELTAGLVKYPQITMSYRCHTPLKSGDEQKKVLAEYKAQLGSDSRIQVWTSRTEPGIKRLLVEGGSTSTMDTVRQLAGAVALELGLAVGQAEG